MVDDGGKTNKDTDWRFQAPLNLQVLSPLMAQRGIEVGGDSSHQKILKIKPIRCLDQIGYREVHV